MGGDPRLSGTTNVIPAKAGIPVTGCAALRRWAEPGNARPVAQWIERDGGKQRFPLSRE
jgi:hypothetical protein